MITFTSSPFTDKANPAYNDSIIRFSSTLPSLIKADIEVEGIAEPFQVYPYAGVFSYNFRDIVKTLINRNGFADSIIPSLDEQFIYSDPNLQLTLNANIVAYNNTTGETTNVSFQFIKSAEQLFGYKRRLSSSNNVKVLLPSQNNFDYEITYYEGYPFDFAVQGLSTGDTYYFRNTNTGMQSDEYVSADGEVKRIYLSDGATNETLGDTLLMTTNVNNIELHVNGQLKANLRILRKESRCGVMLKWFNSNGSYSYWLFDPFYKETFKTKDLDSINGAWDNLHAITSTSESLGKTLEQSIQVTTIYNQNEKEYLLDILKSPKVEMYVHQTPFNRFEEYDFIGVKVSDGSYNHDTKPTQNKLKITIEMPAQNTVTY